MYFIGQTRFSLYTPKSNAWNISGFTEEEYIKHLFSDERMAVRARIFGEISVPMLAKMKKDFDYYHIVSYSSIMPEKWKKLLVDLKNKYPFIYLHEADKEQDNPISIILKDKPNGTVAFFRLDDDDLLSVNFLSSLSKYNSLPFQNMAISFGKGFTGYYKENKFVDFRECKQRFIAIGQAYIGNYIDGKLELPTIHSHHNLDEKYPVIVDSQEPMYIHTHHASQDTNYRFSNDSGNKTDTIESNLMKYPKIKSSDFIGEAFPCVAEDARGFLENQNANYFSKSNLNINQKTTSIPIDNNNEKTLFELEYDVVLPKTLVSPKAMLFAFKFDRDAVVNSGLTFSPYNDIGWFKYISGANGVANGMLSFILDNPARLTELKVVLWDDRFESAFVKSIIVS